MPSDVERASLSSYGLPSLGYYEGYHPTSRFFDGLVDDFMCSHPLPIEPGSRWLEVGSGRGRLHQLNRAGVPFDRCHLDLAPAMLAQCSDDQAALKALGSAFRLPFRCSVFDGVVSFLGDAFSLPAYFQEASRTLRAGGLFVHILPSAVWGRSVRAHRGQALSEAMLAGLSGRRIRVPSILHDPDDLSIMVKNAGFQEVRSWAVTVPRHGPTPPPDVFLAARILGTGVHDLPVLTAVIAIR